MNRTYGFSLIALTLAMVVGLGSMAIARPMERYMDMELDTAQRKELRQLHRDLEDKVFEMEELFEQKTVDTDKAMALHKDMQDVRAKISEFWLGLSLKYKQDHPEWSPRFGGPGMMGMGHGFGMMHHNGWGPHDERDDGPRGYRGDGPRGDRDGGPREPKLLD